MKRYFILFSIAALLLCSCATYTAPTVSDIKIDNIDNVSYSGETIFGDVTVSCNIINPNHAELQIV
ncbi:MAG: hypothetical protein J6Z27_01775 [Bacteroidales bacterium]|nr:hypothetical protein [Bacteroidales bacterium]